MFIVICAASATAIAGCEVKAVGGVTAGLFSSSTALCPAPIFGLSGRVTFTPPGGFGAAAAVGLAVIVGRITKGATLEANPR